MENKEKDGTTKKWIICQECGKRKPDAKSRVDHYNQDVNNKEVYMNLCDECAHERRMDI